MVVINYVFEEGLPPNIYFITSIFDEIGLNQNDAECIEIAIANDDEFDLKPDTFYEIYLERASIASDPVPEASFEVMMILERDFNLPEKFPEDKKYHYINSKPMFKR